MAKQTMVDRIVFRAVGRKVTDADHLAQSIRQELQLLTKQANSIAVATAAVGQQQQRRFMPRPPSV